MPYGLPREEQRLHTLPKTYAEVLRVAEDFRAIALPVLGAGWSKSLPGIPLTKEELKQLIDTRHQRDEWTAMRLLHSLDSESASIIIGLGLDREIISMSLAELQAKHLAQINLLRILRGTRFKYYKYGVLAPTLCPNTFYGRQCGKEDSLSHMLRCYSLEGVKNKNKTR